MSLKNLDEIFSKKIFRIPDYQRGFCWGEQQLEDLWNDILRLRDNAFHFTGTIILQDLLRENKNDDAEKWMDEIPLDYFVFNDQSNNWQLIFPEQKDHIYNPYYVVDGQQRLTSIVILIKCIAERFLVLGNSKFTCEIEDYFIYKVVENKNIYCLGYEKNTPCHEWLINQVYNHEEYPLNEKESFYTHKLDNAKAFFLQKLEAIEYKKDLEDLYIKIKERLKFHIYELDRSLNVSMVFETLNNRGKSLSTLEILKNRLIYLVNELHINKASELRERIVATWQIIYQNLGSKKDEQLDDDEFLRAHWIMYFKNIYLENYNYSQLREGKKFLLDIHFVFSNHTELSVDKINRYLDNIGEASKYWVKIKFPNKQNTDLTSIDYWQVKINSYRSIGGNYFEPLILASYMIYGITDNERLDLLKKIERHNFISFRLCDYKTNFNREHYLRMASRFHDSNSRFFNDLIKDLSNEINRAWDEERFYKNIHENPDSRKQFGFKSWEGLKYLFVEYDNSLKSEYLVNSANKYEVQQIFPNPEENLTNKWTDFSKNYSLSSIIKLHNSLGNQLLRVRKYNQPILTFVDYKETINISMKSKKYSCSEEKFYKDYKEFSDKTMIDRGEKLLTFIEFNWQIKIKQKQQLLLGKNFQLK